MRIVVNAKDVELLTALAVPNRITLDHDSKRERRHWVLRISGGVGALGDDPSTWLTAIAENVVRSAYEQAGLQIEDVATELPAVRVDPIDDAHLLVKIDCIQLGDDRVHTFLS